MKKNNLFFHFFLALVLAGIALGRPERNWSLEDSINEKPEIDKQEAPLPGQTFSLKTDISPIIIRNRQFAIPFSLPANGQIAPTEIELLYSVDEGESWLSFARVPVSSPQKEFFFRANQDGEYLFVLKTWFKSGENRVSAPQKIQVITTAPSPTGPSPTSPAASPASNATSRAETDITEPVDHEEVATPVPSPVHEETVKKPDSLPAGVVPFPSSRQGTPATATPQPKAPSQPTIPSLATEPAATPFPTMGESTKPMDSGEVATSANEPTANEPTDISQTDQSGTEKTGEEVIPLLTLDSPGMETAGTGIKPVPSPSLSTTPKGSLATPEQGDRVRKLLEKSKSSAPRPAVVERDSTQGSEASDSNSGSAETAAASDTIRPGQIKSIGVGRTPSGEPTVMVRWVKPTEVGRPDAKGGMLRIERASTPGGPWSMIADGLESDRNGYWWRATQFDAVPFYLRTVCLDSYGKEWTDVTTDKINLTTVLAGQVLPASSEMGSLAANPATDSKSEDTKGVKTWETPPVPEGVEPGSEHQYLASDGTFGNVSLEKKAAGGSSSSSLSEPTAVGQTASVNKTETAFNYQPLPNPAGTSRPEATSGWRTDPGRMTLNPLFTQGFGSLFQPRRGSQSSGPATANGGNDYGGGSMNVPGTAVPPQNYDRGYNGEMESGYSGGNFQPELQSGYTDNQGYTEGSWPASQGDVPVNSGEIIYLDEHGNRIANPFAAGGPMASVPMTGVPGSGEGFSGEMGGQPLYFDSSGGSAMGTTGSTYGGAPDESNWKPGTTTNSKMPGP